MLSGPPLQDHDGALHFLVLEGYQDLLVLHWLFVGAPLASTAMGEDEVDRNRLRKVVLVDDAGLAHTYALAQRSPGLADGTLVGSVSLRPGVNADLRTVRVGFGSNSVTLAATHT